MGLYRSGHGASSNSSGIITVFGGQGRPLPKDDSNISSRRLANLLQFQHISSAPHSSPSSTPSSSHQDQQSDPAQPQFDIKPIACDLIDRDHTPINREYMVFESINEMAIPSTLFQHFAADSTPLQTTATTHQISNISVMFGGRQSPVITYNDLWVFLHDFNLWVEIISSDRVSVAASSIPDNNDVQPENSPTLPSQQSSLFVFSLHYNNSNNNSAPYSVATLAIIDNQVHLVTHKTITTADHLSRFVVSDLSYPSISVAIDALVANATPETSLCSQQQFTTISARPISNALPIAWPASRFKAASAAHGSLFCLHGGRGGFFLRDGTDDARSQNTGYIIDSTIPTPVKLDKSSSINRQDTQQSPLDKEAKSDADIGCFATTLMYDLWCIDFSSFPFVWQRLDTLTNAQQDILPSARYSHSGAAMTISHDQYQSIKQYAHDIPESTPNQNQPDNNDDNNNDLFFFLFGGLVLSNNILSNNMSSVGTLFPSASLFAFNISALLRKATTSAGDGSLQQPSCFAFQPTLAPTQYCQSVDENTQYKRPLDVFGHHLIAIQHPTTPLLICIGGHSNADPSQCAVHILHFDSPSASHKCANDETHYSPLTWYNVVEMRQSVFSQCTATLINSSCVAPGQSPSTSDSHIAILGGGALCFSFGKFFNSSYVISIPYQGSLSERLQNLSLEQSTSSLHVTTTQQQQLETLLGTKKAPKQQFRNPNKTIMSPEEKQTKNTKGVAQICSVCQESFPSKNKLFHHISITGHKLVANNDNQSSTLSQTPPS